MADILRLPFIVHALLTASFAAVVAAASGYFLVARGLTFAGHALPNIGFAGRGRGRSPRHRAGLRPFRFHPRRRGGRGLRGKGYPRARRFHRGRHDLRTRAGAAVSRPVLGLRRPGVRDSLRKHPRDQRASGQGDRGGERPDPRRDRVPVPARSFSAHSIRPPQRHGGYPYGSSRSFSWRS